MVSQAAVCRRFKVYSGSLMIDYKTVVIQGDISRLDARVLIELCNDKNVIEFGCGGSTLLIARVAKSLHSFDTSREWIDRTINKLNTISSELSCDPQFTLIEDVAEDVAECDVLFLDGKGEDRYKWLKFFKKCNIMICHDSLGDTAGHGPALYHIMSDLFKDMESIELMDRAYFHYLDSNMVVIYRRSEPLKYNNWNIVEKDNRKDPYES